MLIIHTREGHLPDLSDCPRTKLERWPTGNRIGDMGPMGRILVRGETGHAIIPEVAPLPNEIVIDKPGKNAFYRTDLDEILRGRDIRTLLVTGVTTDICGASTVSSANDYGYETVFSRWIATVGERGDLLIALSGSGKSPNILKAIRTAKRKGMKTCLITDYLRTLDMQQSEEYQLVWGHEMMRQLR